MKVILLVEKDLGLARKRPAGAEVDIDPTTAAEWVADKTARYAESTLMEQAALKKVSIVSKPATEKKEG